ncbi:MAG: hypothetical protein H6737_28735 [Alphaproteobacteria bacterium]|nr:hypothetical protein [Alphaproteobacteria bacterium]
MLLALVAPALAQAPDATVSLSMRADAMQTANSGFGLEARTTGPVFARVRVGARPGLTDDLYTIILDRVAAAGSDEVPERQQWLARDASFEVAWSPEPWLRAGAVLTSQRQFDRNGPYFAEYGIRPDTLGVTHLGPEIAFGHDWGWGQAFLRTAATAPVASTRFDRSTPIDINGTELTSRQMHAPRGECVAETRFKAGSVAFDVELGANVLGVAPWHRLANVPGRTRFGAQGAIGIGWVGRAPWERRP